MCGIVGFSGKASADAVLLDGLQRLEYRGYDSAGVAVISDEGELQIRKTKGKVSQLREVIDNNKISGSTGIGHTRWATHGEPNDTNSHPHLSQNESIAVVHNGIIENYNEIKSFLRGKGVRFISDTDTEAVAQLLEYYYQQNNDIMESVYKMLSKIKGAYALGILCRGKKDMLIAARKDAPLLLGFGTEGNYIASDATAIVEYTKDVVYMEDGEVAVITPDSITIYDETGEEIEKEHKTIDWDISAAEKGGYAHFMIKEIMEQPEAVRKTISPRVVDGEINFDDLELSDEYLNKVNRIVIIACGSSYHVGMVCKYTLERLTKIPISVSIASEFRYADPLVSDKTLVITISQSGETSDTLAALREARRLGAKVISVVNVVGSSIARESDKVIYTMAGPEIAVATTKAYSTQLVSLNMFGMYLAKRLHTIDDAEYGRLLKELLAIPEKMEKTLEDADKIKQYASEYFNRDSIFFIGRNIDYAQGLEGSLKLKEISYIHSEAYAAGELKHGTISLIEDGTLVIAICTYSLLREKTVSNIVEVKARGANVLSLTTESHKKELEVVSNNVMVIPEADVIFQPSLGIIPLQLLAYYVALHRGCDIDKPRNLAKSVTVE